MRGKRQGGFSPNRDDGGDGDDSNRWLGTYGDAITLLMAFFVMLYAMSEVDAQKFEAFVRGLQDPFGNTAASEGMLDASSGIVGDAGANVPQDVLADITAALDPSTGAAGPDGQAADTPAELDDMPPMDDMAQLEAVQQAVADSLVAAGLEDLASFRFDGRGLVLSLATDNVLFDSGSTAISPLGRDLLAAVAGPLGEFGNDVFVEGHTDDVPVGRADYTNWNLSTDRAVAVVNLLAAEHAIAPERLGAAGYGEYRPRVANDNARHRAANRRVDVLVVAEGVQING